MKLLILGISGKTGKLVAEEAIKRGHQVVGIARDPGAVTIKNVEIVKGTPYDFETVQKAIVGCDVVLCTLGLFHSSQSLFGKIRTPLDSMSVSTNNAIKAMEETGIKRIVVMTALGTGTSAKELPALFTFMVRITNIKYSYADHDIQEKLLEKSSLDWTVVRPVGLTDKNDNLSVLHNLSGEARITNAVSRNAVAHFMLDCIEKGEFIRQKPGISNS